MTLPFSWSNDASPGKAWKCPDCLHWCTIAGNMGWHLKQTGHGTPILIDQPKPKAVRVKTPPHKDTQRLKTLVDMLEDGDINSDFSEYLFFTRRKTKTTIAAYRRALDQYHRSHG